MLEARSDGTALNHEGAIPALGGWRPAARRGAEAPKPILVIMHGEHSCPGRIGQLLRRKGHALDCRKPRFGCPLPDTLEGHAGVVVFGGPMSCNDDEPYIRAEIDFIGLALKERVPFLGVCLGAQMLAKHLGASVGVHPENMAEIGYYDVRPTAAGRRLGSWPGRFYHWHKEGFELPEGATLLATGDTFPNQAFAYGPTALGVQFHPEITYVQVHRWSSYTEHIVKYRNSQLREAQIDGHLLHARAVEAWLDAALDHWLAGAVVPA